MPNDQITPAFIESLNQLLQPFFEDRPEVVQPLDSQADLVTVGRAIAYTFTDDEEVYPAFVEPFLQLEGPVLPALISVLDDGEVSYFAARLLTIAGTRAVDPLLAALQHFSIRAKEDAIYILGQIKDTRAVEPLIALLSDPDLRVRGYAAQALGELKDASALHPLLKLLHDENEALGFFAAKAINQLGQAALLMAEIGNPDPRIRRRIAIELGNNQGSEEVFKTLNTLLTDPDIKVRAAAAHGLGVFGDPRAVNLLIELLQDTNQIMASSAMTALGMLRDADAVEPLIVALRDSHDHIRQHAAYNLGKLRDSRAVQPLIDALKDKALVVRSQAAASLGYMMHSDAVAPLIAALEDSHSVVCHYAASALGQLYDDRSIDPLIKMLTHTNIWLRKMAADSLGRLASPRAVPALIELMQEPEKGTIPEMGVGTSGEPVKLVKNTSHIVRSAVNALTAIATPEALAAVEAWEQQNSHKG
ncbi:MAG TPA: HEAT repeat domain-containing protein [Aggregatilineales bacterium]|nr:HEAT repeat domain-containing protein [Aggregatilineales bacterium]